MRQKLIQLSNINYQNASICSGIRVDVTCREMQQEHIIQTSLKRFSQDSYQRSSSDHRYQTSNLFKWQFFYFTFHTESVCGNITKLYQTLQIVLCRCITVRGILLQGVLCEDSAFQTSMPSNSRLSALENRRRKLRRRNSFHQTDARFTRRLAEVGGGR